jgi:hypothetical protein
MTTFDWSELTESQCCLARYIEDAHNRVVCPFVKEHGKFFLPAPLPKGIQPGNVGACFPNSRSLLKRHGTRHGLVYAEGYAIRFPGDQNVTLHAWCVDCQGTVFDRAWREGSAYFGIEFKTDYVLARIKQGEESGEGLLSLLDDWANQHPLIRELGSRPDIWQHHWGTASPETRAYG